jgi:glucan 1,3-beta-glucosidase
VILAALFVATMVAAIHVALGLVFDPRYKDFPLASLTGPAVALFTLAFANARTPPNPGQAEIVAAAVLGGSAVFVMANEGSANWQAVWFALLLVLLALTAIRARALPG